MFSVKEDHFLKNFGIFTAIFMILIKMFWKLIGFRFYFHTLWLKAKLAFLGLSEQGVANLRAFTKSFNMKLFW